MSYARLLLPLLAGILSGCAPVGESTATRPGSSNPKVVGHFVLERVP